MKTSSAIVKHEQGFAFRFIESTVKQHTAKSIVFIHGMAGTGRYFIPMMHVLADHGYHSYALDLPGHGVSKHGMHFMGIRDYVHHTKSFIDTVIHGEHGAAPDLVVGHSMGGLIALILATESHCNHKTIAITPATFSEAGRGTFLWFHIAQEIVRSLPREFLYRIDPRTYWKGNSRPYFANDLLSYVLQEGVWESLRVVYEIVQEQVHLNQHSTMPTLVIGAGKDMVIPQGSSRRIVECMGRLATHHMEHDFGHMAPYENPHRMVEIITDWLRLSHTPQKRVQSVRRTRRAYVSQALTV